MRVSNVDQAEHKTHSRLQIRQCLLQYFIASIWGCIQNDWYSQNAYYNILSHRYLEGLNLMRHKR